MLKIPQRVSHIFLFSILFAGSVFALFQHVSAGGADTAIGTCSIAAWQNGSNPLSWSFRMDINAIGAAAGSVRPGHPGIASPWTPYLASPGATYSTTYTSAGNKTVYGRYNYHKTGSSTVLEISCSRTITATAPVILQLCRDPAAVNNGGALPCRYVIPGCTNPAASNYNPFATVDDGSCIIGDGGVRGCTNSAAPNYNPRATIDDGSCVPGCTNPAASNYNPRATFDDGSCIIGDTGQVRGCTNPAATNYNPRATIDDGSCTFPPGGGGNPGGGGTPPPPVSIPGCTNSGALNYNPSATLDNGSCVFAVWGCTNPVALNYNPSANSDDGSCVMPVPGCTDPSAINYDSGANVDDGSCQYDQCLNISGDQLTVPAGLDQWGGNCYFPAPTCSPAAGVDVFTGESFSVKINIRNNSSVTLDLTSVRYNGPVTGIPNGDNPDVGGNGSLDVSGSHTLNTPTSGTVTWVIAYNQPSGLGNATVTCEQTVTVKNRPPTCEVLGINPANPLAGEGFQVRVRVRNPNPSPISITGASYDLPGTRGVIDNKTGNANAGFPSPISANSTNDYASATNVRVYDTNYDINVAWRITADSGTATCEFPNDPTIRPDIILLPPTCTATVQVVTVGVPFKALVSVQNPNLYAPLDLQDTGYEVTLLPSNLKANADNSDSGNRWRGGVITIPSNGSLSLESVTPPELVVLVAGDSRIDWEVNSEAGPAGGDCAPLGATTTLLSAYTRPYTRFYGNDVFAGGNYGDTCTIGSSASARGYGFYAAGGNNHRNYRGSAAELAVFAVGQIDGVLPGSQVVTRGSLSALGFSNTSAGSGALPFGGNFGSQMCADDYWGERPASAGAPATTIDSGTGLQVVTLNTIANGSYSVSGSVHIRTTGAIPAGKRVTLYVDGNVWVGDSSYNNPGGDKQLAYDTSRPWADMDQIPLIRIISRGNIYVDNNITQMDGMYVAVPNGANTGEIHTCARAEATDDLRNPTLDEPVFAAECRRPLLVNGAFIAKRVHLLRINGNIGNAPAAPDAYNSGQQAETFRFSPELYLALISQGGPTTSVEFDAIQTLPPAL